MHIGSALVEAFGTCENLIFGGWKSLSNKMENATIFLKNLNMV